MLICCRGAAAGIVTPRRRVTTSSTGCKWTRLYGNETRRPGSDGRTHGEGKHSRAEQHRDGSPDQIASDPPGDVAPAPTFPRVCRETCALASSRRGVLGRVDAPLERSDVALVSRNVCTVNGQLARERLWAGRLLRRFCNDGRRCRRCRTLGFWRRAPHAAREGGMSCFTHLWHIEQVSVALDARETRIRLRRK